MVIITKMYLFNFFEILSDNITPITLFGDKLCLIDVFKSKDNIKS